MPFDLEPFALLRLETQCRDCVVGHLLITPWLMAFISTTSERVTEYSWILAPHGDARVRAALIEYARWPVPLVLEQEDEVYALATRVAPSASRIEVTTVNLSSASYGGLINTLITWRTEDLVPSWPSIMAAMCAVASSRHTDRVRSIEERGLGDTPLFTICARDGDPIVTMSLRPSSRQLRACVYQECGRWIERIYSTERDGTWVVRDADGTTRRSLSSPMDVALDALVPGVEGVAPSRWVGDAVRCSYQTACMTTTVAALDALSMDRDTTEAGPPL